MDRRSPKLPRNARRMFQSAIARVSRILVAVLRRSGVVDSSIRYHAVAIALVLSLEALSCRQSPRAVEMWIVDSASPLTSDASAAPKPGAFDITVGPRRVELRGAINESLSFVFGLESEAGVPHPTIRVDALRSATGSIISASAIRVYRMHAVSLGDWPGWHIRSTPSSLRPDRVWDVLVPIEAPVGGIPDHITAHQPIYFWVDVDVPKGTAASTYAGAVRMASNDVTVATIDIDLSVWPFVLPDDADFATLAELHEEELLSFRSRSANPRTAHARAVSILRLLHDHRVAGVVSDLSPDVQINAAGDIALDWQGYDALVEPCLSGAMFENRARTPFWPLPTDSLLTSEHDALFAASAPGDRNAETQQTSGIASRVRLSSGRAASSAKNRLVEQYLRKCVEHFEEKGWIDRAYVMLPPPESFTSESLSIERQLAAMIAGTEPRVAVATSLWPQDMRPFGWFGYPSEDHARFADSVDIWCPPAQFFDRGAVLKERAAGRRIWMAMDRPPFSGTTDLHAPPSYIRVLSWQALDARIEALRLGRATVLARESPAAEPHAIVRREPTNLLYAGAPFGLHEPVPSVRIKHLRRSMQDAAYAKLLSQRGLGHIVDSLRRSLCAYFGTDAYGAHFADGRPVGWPDDVTVFNLARDIMAGELAYALEANKDRAGSPLDPFARKTLWRRFLSEVQRVDVGVDGARFRLVGDGGPWSADVEMFVRITNLSREPLHGTLAVDHPPHGWSSAGLTSTLPPIPPDEAYRAVLSARVTALPQMLHGFSIVPITFTGTGGTATSFEARVAMVTAVPLSGPVRIDGDLSDWPPGRMNVASDFRQIGAFGSSPIERPVDLSHASRETIGFVMRDEQYLYFGINCAGRPDTTVTQSSSNRVRYDDLIPDGGALVELLIDPHNTGTRSPADLFHVTVMPSGAYQAERGLRSEPLCGARAPWPSDLEVSTRILADRWIIELRIPLASFGAAATRSTIWGLNITRFDALTHEFTNWSGAIGNVYDPLSLGNLYLP